MSNETTPGNVRVNDGLGLMPEPDVCHEMARDDWSEDWSYSADAMRTYGAEQVAAERERCARIVERLNGWLGVREVAAEIRGASNLLKD